MEVFGTVHRALLQWMLNEQQESKQGCVKEVEIINFLQSILEKLGEQLGDVDHEDEAGLRRVLPTLLARCKQELDARFGMDIKRYKQDGCDLYAIVNTLTDDISPLATDYSQEELAYLRKLMELILTSSASYEITSIEAINEARNVDIAATQRQTQSQEEDVEMTQTVGSKKISPAQAQALINRFVKDGWLAQNRGRLSLSARSVMDLEYGGGADFLDSFPDLAKCGRCERLMLHLGIMCPQCDTHLYHKDCGKALQTAASSLTCSECQHSFKV
jgi:hypothetical protein